MCGAAAGEGHPHDGRPVRLHIGHIQEKSQGGSAEPENLRALCSLCNEGVADLSLHRPDAIRLLAQIRRAKGDDQIEVLAWLIKKYPQQASDLANDEGDG